MKFSVFSTIALFTAALGAKRTPSETSIHSHIPSDTVGPQDFVNVGGDGVLRVFTTPEFNVSFAVPLNTGEISDILISMHAANDTKASFEGVDGYSAPISQQMQPSEDYISELRENWQQNGGDRSHLELPERSALRVLKARQGLSCPALFCTWSSECRNSRIVSGCRFCVTLRSARLGACL